MEDTDAKQCALVLLVAWKKEEEGGSRAGQGKKETNMFVGFYDSSVNQLETWRCTESPLLLPLRRE